MKNFLFEIKKAYEQIFLYPTSRIGVLDTDYDDYWKDKRGEKIGTISKWQKKRADIILRNMGCDAPMTIMDIGCADGAVLKYIKEKADVAKMIGVDVSEFALKKAEEFGVETVRADIGEIKNLEEMEDADYILALEVLEHIQNSEGFLAIMIKKAKKGVFFSFPNTGFYAYRLRLLFGKFPAQWRVHPGEHLRFWTSKDLKWWLKAQGIENYRIFYYEGVPLLNKIVPSLFAAGFVVHIITK